MATQMPPVAQFSLPKAGTPNQPAQTPTGMPPVAKFSLPTPAGAQTSNQSAPNGMVGALGGIANTFAPALGDIGAAMQGKPTGKSAEQLTGDALTTGATAAGLASIPFTGGLDIPALMGISAGLGAAQGVGGALQQNAAAPDVAKQGVIGGAIGAGTAGVLGAVGKGLTSLAGQSVNMALKPTVADISDGYSSSFAVKNGLTGSAKQVAAKTGDFIKGLTTQLKTALGGSDASIDLSDVFSQTQKELTSETGLQSNFLQNSGISKALDKVASEIKIVSPNGSVPMLGAQTIKQATGMYGEWVNGVPDPEANALGTVANAFYHNLKTAIEDGVPNEDVAGINAQIQKAIPIMRAAIRRIPVAARASALSLTDMLAFLGLSVNPPAAIAADMAQHAMTSGLASRLLPAVASKIPNLTPAISSFAPAVAQGVQGLLPH